MTKTTKIVFIGAGSMAFGLGFYRDLFSTRELAGSTLTLVDTNAAALERMYGLANAMNAKSGLGLKIEQTTDRRAALDGAGFVVNSVAIDRNRLWKLDFQVPKKHGIRHTLGENGGPGGLFFTMRTLPLIFDFARDMAELCPNALFINYSNPESRIILALGKYGPVKAVGLCHGLSMGRGAVADITGVPWEHVDALGAGLNHFQWIMHLRDRRTGEDLYPLLREKEKTHDPDDHPLTRRLFHAFGYWPTCSDDHLGEYVSFGWEGGEHGYDYAEDERERTELQAQIDSILAGAAALPDGWSWPVQEKANEVIAGVLHNQKRVIEAGVVYNNGAIPNLPPDLGVEVPIMVDAAGVHPISLGPLPDAMAKVLSMPAHVHQLAVEAAVHASKELALQALLADPVVTSSEAAIAILDELWEVNRPYIRRCI